MLSFFVDNSLDTLVKTGILSQVKECTLFTCSVVGFALNTDNVLVKIASYSAPLAIIGGAYYGSKLVYNYLEAEKSKAMLIGYEAGTKGEPLPGKKALPKATTIKLKQD